MTATGKLSAGLRIGWTKEKLINDDRLWSFEEELWTGGADVYDEKVAQDAVMALPSVPYVFDRQAAIAAVKDTPRWDSVSFENKRVERHDQGLIGIAYRATAKRGDQTYRAICTSVLQRLGHENWVVIQHQQTPLGVEVAAPTRLDRRLRPKPDGALA